MDRSGHIKEEEEELMHYLTKAGVKFLNETGKKRFRKKSRKRKKKKPTPVSRSESGSSVHGTEHHDMHHAKRVAHNVIKEMDAAHANGQEITLRHEGRKGGRGYEGSEHEHIHKKAKAHADKHGMKVKYDTLEHDDADTDNKHSKIVKHLHGEHGEDQTNAALFAMHHSQGRSHEESKHHLTDGAKKHLDRHYGKPKGKNGTYTKRQRKAMFHRSFPRDNNPKAKPTVNSQIVDHHNSERQRLMMQHKKNDEAQGGVSIHTIGSGHFAEDHGSIGDKFKG